MNLNYLEQWKGLNFNERVRLFKELSSQFSLIVFVGLSLPEWRHSHYYIYLNSVSFLQKMNLKVLWKEDAEIDFKKLPPRSIVIISDHILLQQYCDERREQYIKRMVSWFCKDHYYLLHRGDSLIKLIEDFKYLRLYEYRNSFYTSLSKGSEEVCISEFMYFFPSTRSLLQPWGVNKLQDEFMDPTCCRETNIVHFIGTVWGDQNSLKEGNRKILDEIKNELKCYGFELMIHSNISEKRAAELVRHSYVSISPASAGHNRDSYLQCRTFKNIAYGRFTFTNVEGFGKVLNSFYIPISSFADAVNSLQLLNGAQEKECARYQQKLIKDYTYLEMWLNIFGSFLFLYG